MRQLFLLSLLALFFAATHAEYADYANATATGCSYSATCSVGGVTGVCVSVSAGCCAGATTSGLCAGSSDIKCCTNNPCTTPAGKGSCMQASLCSAQGGKAISGYCTGPSEMQCCVNSASKGYYGVDISGPLTASVAACFKSNGATYIVPRGYRSSGNVDTEVCNSLKVAASAGIATRDVYIFPCPKCSKSAATQVKELVDHLNANCKSSWSGRVWLDIEGAQYWPGPYATNQNWYKSFVDTCNAVAKCGVYTAKSQWEEIFGSSKFSYGSNLPLWYPRYDNDASFSDFSPFGGWTTPHAKQYVGDTTQCNMGIDKNYAANPF